MTAVLAAKEQKLPIVLRGMRRRSVRQTQLPPERLARMSAILRAARLIGLRPIIISLRATELATLNPRQIYLVWRSTRALTALSLRVLFRCPILDLNANEPDVQLPEALSRNPFLPSPFTSLNCVFQGLKKLRSVAWCECRIESSAPTSFTQVLLHFPHRKRHADVRLAERLARRPYALSSNPQTPCGK